jgi:hypothetical protein
VTYADHFTPIIGDSTATDLFNHDKMLYSDATLLNIQQGLPAPDSIARDREARLDRHLGLQSAAVIEQKPARAVRIPCDGGVVAMPPRANSLCSLRVLSILTRSGPHLELLLIVRLQTTCDRPVKHVRKMT